MSDRTFVERSLVPAPVSTVFAWHERPGALARLTPPWERMTIVERSGRGLEAGVRATLRLGVGPFSVTWVAEHDRYERDRLFRDRQVSGPFARWVHTHRFEPAGDDATWMEDVVEYALPFGAPGALAGGRFTARKLSRQFAWRHRTAREDIVRHRASPPPGRVLVSGSGGLVGSALIPFLRTGGSTVSRLVRGAATEADEIAGTDAVTDAAFPDGLDAVVHLAGAGIAERRWSPERKATIRRSRVEMTGALSRRLAAMTRKPKVLLCASATGWYGDRRDEPVDEDSPGGDGFLADVCREWEAATAPAVEAGIRVVHMRFGMVLSPAGGALARLLPVYRFGLGGRLGDGTQPVSWIALDDALYAMLHALGEERLSGPVLFTAPEPMTQRAFNAALARATGRPAKMPVPAFALRLLFGEMADALLLGGVAARPKRLAANGFRYAWPDLDGALAHLLGRLPAPDETAVSGGGGE